MSDITTDIKLGQILLKYIDRLSDPVPEDPLERIVSEILTDTNKILGRGRFISSDFIDKPKEE